MDYFSFDLLLAAAADGHYLVHQSGPNIVLICKSAEDWNAQNRNRPRCAWFRWPIRGGVSFLPLIIRIPIYILTLDISFVLYFSSFLYYSCVEMFKNSFTFGHQPHISLWSVVVFLKHYAVSCCCLSGTVELPMFLEWFGAQRCAILFCTHDHQIWRRFIYVFFNRDSYIFPLLDWMDSFGVAGDKQVGITLAFNSWTNIANRN